MIYIDSAVRERNPHPYPVMLFPMGPPFRARVKRSDSKLKSNTCLFYASELFVSTDKRSLTGRRKDRLPTAAGFIGNKASSREIERTKRCQRPETNLDNHIFGC